MNAKRILLGTVLLAVVGLLYSTTIADAPTTETASEDAPSTETE